MYYVYILKSKRTERLYLGFTDDLRRRVHEHQTGQSRYTKDRGPYALVYYEAYLAKKDAMRREKQLKQFKKGYKMLELRMSESLKMVA